MAVPPQAVPLDRSSADPRRHLREQGGWLRRQALGFAQAFPDGPPACLTTRPPFWQLPT